MPKYRGVVIFLAVMIGLVLLIASLHTQSSGVEAGPVRQRDVPIAKVPVDDGIRYTNLTVPCAVDEDAAHMIITAVRDKDTEAIYGLMARGKAVMLTEGTKFEPSGSAPEGFAWGFVKSGRNVGTTCYLPESWLQKTKPGKVSAKS